MLHAVVQQSGEAVAVLHHQTHAWTRTLRVQRCYVVHSRLKTVENDAGSAWLDDLQDTLAGGTGVLWVVVLCLAHGYHVGVVAFEALQREWSCDCSSIPFSWNLSSFYTQLPAVKKRRRKKISQQVQ